MASLTLTSPRQCIFGFLVRETRCHLFVQSTSPLKPKKLAIFSAVICNPKCCILFMYFWLMSLPSIFTCANFCPGLIAGWHENFHFHFFIFYFPLYFYFSQFSLGQTFAQQTARFTTRGKGKDTVGHSGDLFDTRLFGGIGMVFEKEGESRLVFECTQ